MSSLIKTRGVWQQKTLTYQSSSRPELAPENPQHLWHASSTRSGATSRASTSTRSQQSPSPRKPEPNYVTGSVRDWNMRSSVIRIIRGLPKLLKISMPRRLARSIPLHRRFCASMQSARKSPWASPLRMMLPRTSPVPFESGTPFSIFSIISMSTLGKC